jgi:hypothetical protein
MEENAGHANQREQLKREMKKLRRAMKSIQDLESGGTSDAGFEGLLENAMDMDTSGIEV